MINRLLAPLLMFLLMSLPPILLLLVLLTSSALRADQLDDWTLGLLFAPTTEQLEQEARGRVHIYSGLRDTEVARALDEQFNRIDAMMFTGTIVTDQNGEAVKDPKTGEMLVENDGC